MDKFKGMVVDISCTICGRQLNSSRYLYCTHCETQHKLIGRTLKVVSNA